MLTKKNNGFFSSNRFLMIFSLVLSVIIWLVVTGLINTTGRTTMRDVPIVIDSNSSIITRQGLRPVTTSQTVTKATVTIEGASYVIGNLKAEDVTITADLSRVTGAGEYDLPLIAHDAVGNRFDVLTVRPDTIKVTFDRTVGKSYTVDLNILSVSAAGGYIMEEPVLEKTEVTITGPEYEVQRVARVGMDVSFKEPLVETQDVNVPVKLYNAAGNEITSELLQVEPANIAVTVGILKVKELPVTFQYVNVPPNLSVDKLNYTISHETLMVAGPTYAIDRYTEIPLGYIDIRSLGTSTYHVLDVKMPAEGIYNLGDVSTVTVDFSSETLGSKYLDVTNIVLLNVPADYDVTLTSDRISDVYMVGDAQVVETLEEGDLVAEIDLSTREITSGQFRVRATVYSPNTDMVWAFGDHYAYINVREK